jgi:hypothetical protein
MTSGCPMAEKAHIMHSAAFSYASLESCLRSGMSRMVGLEMRNTLDRPISEVEIEGCFNVRPQISRRRTAAIEPEVEVHRSSGRLIRSC